MDFLPKNIADYALNHTEKESDLLSDLSRETWSKVVMPRMLSGHLQGRILSMLSNLIRPKRILEVGTYTGYSALCLAEGLEEGGELHTLDVNEEFTFIASKYFKKSKYKENITQHQGDAVKIIPNLPGLFQLAFIDADKESYCNYFDLIIKKIEIGGIIIADNVLWSGKVVKNIKDKESTALDAYNKKILSDKRVENILLPVRDGLMICRRIT